jgi:hypothetical protein
MINVAAIKILAVEYTDDGKNRRMASWTGNPGWLSIPPPGALWTHCPAWSGEHFHQVYFNGPTDDPLPAFDIRHDAWVTLEVKCPREVFHHLLEDHGFQEITF